jgi:hypothetical protein
MASRAFFLAILAAILFLPVSKAQSSARVDCARSDEYVYLYSSITTLQVRATLQCGEIVNITLRYDDYYGVRTSKGEEGFVSKASVVVLRDESKDPVSATPAERERTHYDQRPREAAPRKAIPAFTLLKDTPVKVKLTKTLSSATARVGDPVEFEVLDDVQVEGVTVLGKGAKVTGSVAEATPKKRFGHSGSLAVSISSLKLDDGEQAPLRTYEEAKGSPGGVSLAKEATMAQDSEFTLLIDGDVHLKRSAFENAKSDHSSALSPENVPAKP